MTTIYRDPNIAKKEAPGGLSWAALGFPTISDVVRESVERQASTLAVREGDLGLGLFASVPMNAGDLILEFTGELISFEQAVAKGVRQCYPLQVSPREYMDLHPLGCFANHSCAPNAAVRNMSLVALRDIRPMEEVRYDYSTTMDENYWTMNCLCRSRACRGVVRDFKTLTSDLQDWYLSRGLVVEFIARQFSLEAESTDQGT